MTIPEGQPIYFKFKDNILNPDPPTEFGYVPDPAACSNLEYRQLVDQTDTTYFQFDLDQVHNAEEIQSNDFSASTGWSIGGGWSIGAGTATITNAVSTSILSQNTFDISRVGYLYKVEVEVLSITGVVQITGPLGATHQLTEGSNTFYIKVPNTSLFEIRALTGSSADIDEVSVKQMPSTAILSVWKDDGTYQGELQFKPWTVTSGLTLTDNKLLYVWDWSSFGLADGCYYFSSLDPSLGQGVGDAGLANGEWNVGNPNVNDLYLWTKTLGASVTAVGGNGLLTYNSTASNGGTITSQFTSLRAGITYDIEFKINSVTGVRVRFLVGATTTAFTTGVGTHTISITPAATGLFVVEFDDLGAPNHDIVLDYIRITLNDGQDLFTNNASNIIKLGTPDCTHLIKACPGEAYGFLNNFQIRYRVYSKITGWNFDFERIKNRLSTGERKLGYADTEEGRDFVTDFVPIPELLTLSLAALSKVFQIDDVRYWVQDDDFEPQFPPLDTEHASLTFNIIEYDQILESKNCDGAEPSCG